MPNINLKENFILDNFQFVNFINLSSKEKDLVLAWRNADIVRKWMINDQLISRQDHYSFLESLQETNSKYYWVIKNQDNGYLGVLSLFRIDYQNKNAYYGMYANPEYQSPGIGMLFNKLVLKLVFELMGLHTLKQEAIAGNMVIEIHKGMGFTEEGRLKEYVLKDGEWKDIIVLGMLESDYRG